MVPNVQAELKWSCKAGYGGYFMVVTVVYCRVLVVPHGCFLLNMHAVLHCGSFSIVCLIVSGDH
jgi:hypothetical protein